MATETYIAMASHTLTGSTSSITISSIPSTYKDLILVVSGTGATLDTCSLRFNGDTASNYTWVIVNGAENTFIDGNVNRIFAGQFDSSQSHFIAQIFDYSVTNHYKPVLTRSSYPDAASAFQTVSQGMYKSTSAITSIEIRETTYQTGTTINLYGIA